MNSQQQIKIEEEVSVSQSSTELMCPSFQQITIPEELREDEELNAMVMKCELMRQEIVRKIDSKMMEIRIQAELDKIEEENQQLEERKCLADEEFQQLEERMRQLTEQKCQVEEQIRQNNERKLRVPEQFIRSSSVPDPEPEPEPEPEPVVVLEPLPKEKMNTDFVIESKYDNGVGLIEIDDTRKLVRHFEMNESDSTNGGRHITLDVYEDGLIKYHEKMIWCCREKCNGREYTIVDTFTIELTNGEKINDTILELIDNIYSPFCEKKMVEGFHRMDGMVQYPYISPIMRTFSRGQGNDTFGRIALFKVTFNALLTLKKMNP